MIGRDKEIAELEELYNGNEAEFVAIYGRRRIGKTYLVEETFKDRFSFKHTGLSPLEYSKNGILNAQLNQFYNSLIDYGMDSDTPKPDNWLDAFFLLQKLLEKENSNKRQVVFIDELPWMDTARSGFITALEGFWNGWGSHQHNLLMIVCGSANSWMLNSLINNHGGLYGRITYEIKLSPFTLSECEMYLTDRGINISRYDIAQSYMIFGGVPYYLRYFKKGLSLSQNIDNIFYQQNATLRFEYDRLFASIFSNPELTKSVVELLYTRNYGYTRKEITEKLNMTDGGTITSCLNALIASDFIIKYVPFGMNKKQEHYKLTDPFCIFYLRFVKDINVLNGDYWTQNIKSQQMITWRGLAFENLCFNHIRQIKSALGISGVTTTQSAWSKRGDEQDGVQIDLLINRSDNVINMCEIKFYNDDFKVDKSYYRTILHRQEVLSDYIKKSTAIHSTLITSFGITKNEYSDIFSNVITLDDLFMD